MIGENGDQGEERRESAYVRLFSHLELFESPCMEVWVTVIAMAPVWNDINSMYHSISMLQGIPTGSSNFNSLVVTTLCLHKPPHLQTIVLSYMLAECAKTTSSSFSLLFFFWSCRPEHLG